MAAVAVCRIYARSAEILTPIGLNDQIKHYPSGELRLWY